ncbi:hypothetical protein [Geobacillus vulcani]|uniref:hypothetical protein n=1 Tax=Geobacillus vulcani TaxID=135517 RepID=UPI0004DF9101|nr:hypothetical protein [Geobacillus vulcani]
MGEQPFFHFVKLFGNTAFHPFFLIGFIIDAAKSLTKKSLIHFSNVEEQACGLPPSRLGVTKDRTTAC